MCHQTVGLAANIIEASGIPTLIIGSARDIIEELGVPRFAFTDLPLGNPIGPADDPDQQRRVLATALSAAAAMTLPRTTSQIDTTWNGDPDWRTTFMSLDDPEALRAEGDARRARQAAKKSSF